MPGLCTLFRRDTNESSVLQSFGCGAGSHGRRSSRGAGAGGEYRRQASEPPRRATAHCCGLRKDRSGAARSARIARRPRRTRQATAHRSRRRNPRRRDRREYHAPLIRARVATLARGRPRGSGAARSLHRRACLLRSALCLSRARSAWKYSAKKFRRRAAVGLGCSPGSSHLNFKENCNVEERESPHGGCGVCAVCGGSGGRTGARGGHRYQARQFARGAGIHRERLRKNRRSAERQSRPTRRARRSGEAAPQRSRRRIARSRQLRQLARPLNRNDEQTPRARGSPPVYFDSVAAADGTTDAGAAVNLIDSSVCVSCAAVTRSIASRSNITTYPFKSAAASISRSAVVPGPACIVSFVKFIPPITTASGADITPPRAATSASPSLAVPRTTLSARSVSAAALLSNAITRMEGESIFN